MRGSLSNLIDRTPALLTRRTFLTSGLAATAGFALYTNEWGRHHLDITRRTIFLRNLPPAFDGFRIAQLSDIHLEEFTEDFFLRHVIAEANALSPDLLLVTGDFISRGPMPLAVSFDAAARCAEMLAQLTCPQRFGILGNHDAIVGPKVIRDHMEANGLPILVDEFVRIERGGQHFFLAGLADLLLRPSLERALPALPDAPVLLMVHEPDYAETIAKHPLGRFVDLILSGHTHGGQIRIPGIRPLALPPGGKLFPQGHYQVGPSQLYVNRGIGTVGIPFRLNCPPELTEFTLRPATPERA